MARAHVDLELRWADQDAYGHINNVAYARYLEEARVRVFFQGSGRERTGMERHFRGDVPGGPMMLLASQQIEFLRVLEYGDRPIVAELWVGRIGGSSLEIHAEILDGSPSERAVVARGISTIVMVDAESGLPQRLSPEARSSIELWTDEPLRLRRA